MGKGMCISYWKQSCQKTRQKQETGLCLTFFQPVSCYLATTCILETSTMIGGVRLQITNQRKKEWEKGRAWGKGFSSGPPGVIGWYFCPSVSSFQDYSDYKIHSVEEDESQFSITSLPSSLGNCLFVFMSQLMLELTLLHVRGFRC